MPLELRLNSGEQQNKRIFEELQNLTHQVERFTHPFDFH